LVIVVVSFRPPRDHDTCSSSFKQARDTWPLPEPPNMSPHPIQTPSDSGGWKEIESVMTIPISKPNLHLNLIGYGSGANQPYLQQDRPLG